MCSLLKRPKHYKDRPVAAVAQAVSASLAVDTPDTCCGGHEGDLRGKEQKQAQELNMVEEGLLRRRN